MNGEDNSNQPMIPEAKAQSYVLDVLMERTGEEVYRVSEADREELEDLVVFYHSALEEIKRRFEPVDDLVNTSLGYENL